MSTPFHNLPPGITEEDLLALVEGDLGEPRAQAIRAALARRPDLLRLTEAMRDDRGALATLEPARAPAGLVAAAESTLQRPSRDRLLAGALVEPEVTTLRVSSVRHARRPGVLASIADLLASSTLARGLAVAAGFSLAAGVLLWGVLAIVAEISQPVRIADNQPPSPPVLERDPGAATEPQLATNAEPDAEPPFEFSDPALAANDPALDGPIPEPGIEPLPLAADMDGEQALALARQGRLAVRVRVGSADLALARVENLRRQAQREGIIWRTLPANLSGPIHLAMADSSRPVAAPGTTHPDSTVAASQPGADRRARPSDPELPTLPEPIGVLAAAYDLHLPASATTLDSLRRALTRDRFQVAEFVELPEPVETDPVLDPRAMFWWEQPPAAWEKKIRVPVLIESIE